MYKTDQAEWLKDAVEEARRVAEPGRDITINITLNDNSVHNHDNRTVVLQSERPQGRWLGRQRVNAVCHPSRNQLTGYVYNPHEPLDFQQIANEAITGF